MRKVASPSMIFASACLGILLFGIALITLGSVAPEIQRQFQMDTISAGALFSILPFGILAGTLVFGPFADRYGYRMIFVLSCLAMFTGFQGIAYASDLNVLKVCVFFFGLGGGAINGATNAVVSDVTSENKGANLSLLGVFFAIGALGMPLLLATLQAQFSVGGILSFIGYATLLSGIFFLLVKFPLPKQTKVISFPRVIQLLKDQRLLLIGFFLFFQSGFEGIINNWTTTYLTEKAGVEIRTALYALSLYVAGMAVMRLIHGSVLRKTRPKIIMLISFVLLAVGAALMQLGGSYAMSVSGLVLLGAGLAGGFPVMLGFVGERFAEFSGTAFSIAISIALVGNMAINYTMGIVAANNGIEYLVTVAFTLTVVMAILTVIILQKTDHR